MKINTSQAPKKVTGVYKKSVYSLIRHDWISKYNMRKLNVVYERISDPNTRFRGEIARNLSKNVILWTKADLEKLDVVLIRKYYQLLNAEPLF